MLQFLQLPSVANELQMAIIEGKPVDALPASGEKALVAPAPIKIKRHNITKGKLAIFNLIPTPLWKKLSEACKLITYALLIS